jgi:hypothetical protein
MPRRESREPCHENRLAGIGLSAVSPWANSGISSTTFNFGAGVYLCIIAVMASSIGGYLAGRLRTKWVGVHNASSTSVKAAEATPPATIAAQETAGT